MKSFVLVLYWIPIANGKEFVNDVVISTLMSLHVPLEDIEPKAEKLINRFGDMILDFYHSQMSKNK